MKKSSARLDRANKHSVLINYVKLLIAALATKLRPAPTRRRLVLRVLLVLTFTASVGCAVADVAAAPVILTEAGEPVVCRADTLLVLAVLVDGSKSIVASTSRRPTLSDLKHALAYAEHCGIDMAVGAVRDLPTPLERIALAPGDTRGRPPTVQASGLLGELLKQQAEQRAATEREAAARARTTKIREFVAKIEPILQPTALSDYTDLVRQLTVVETFLMQPRPGSLKLRRVLIVYSDGRQTVPPRRLRSLAPDIRVYLVNALDDGDFPAHAVTRFTDFDAAFAAATGGD
ncbi:MAG: hypothetical protein M3Q69_05710 [Acidobacteriota bacterium]|nr:hypothetical protein [Acidobacteriota bacterium]